MAYQEALAALADSTRREIFERLRARPASVGELADRMPVSRPAVSQHLKVLKSARLVSERREGTRRVYSVDPAGVADLRQYLDTLWSDALGALQQHADRRPRGAS